MHADHLPPFNPSRAIAYSCNYYFATLGQRLGRDKLIATLREFDFSQPTGLPAQKSQRRGLRNRKRRAIVRGIGQSPANKQTATRAAIGESDSLQVTPIQLLTAYAALVNGGHLYKPRIADALDFQATERARLNISQSQHAIITEGMAGAVRFGTARSAKLDSLPLTIIGKTGTANPPKGFRANGWFIGFAAPFESNREVDAAAIDLAVLVLLPRAHGSQAAELARPIFAASANISKPDREGERVLKHRRLQPIPAINPLFTMRNRQGHLVHDNVAGINLEPYSA